MKEESNRRKFLGGAMVRAGAAAGVAGLTLGAGTTTAKGKPTKIVITKPGEPLKPETILSPAIQFGNLIFVSGQTAHDPQTRKLAEGSFANQVKQSLGNVKDVLEAAGSSPDRVLKCTVFLTDIANFQEMNRVYHAFFATNPSARSTMAVKDLPMGTPVEIECIAYVDGCRREPGLAAVWGSRPLGRLDEIQRSGIDAVAKVGWFWPIIENVSEMSIASAARDL